MGKKKREKLREQGLTKKTADRHDLYQRAVQNPQFEVDLFHKLFKRRVGRTAVSLREDFCGTALLCGEWVKSKPERTALGVDIDASVLEWGRQNVLDGLGDARDRVTLVEGDVRDMHDGTHDVVVALNYSYFCFKTRDGLRAYFEAARRHLVDDGLFFCDLFGGWEAQQELKEKRKVDKAFKYVWHQASFNPITADFLAHIHFELPDGSKLKKAFTYDWRLWTLPEVRELLREAGFEHVEVLWEDEDEDGDGNGNFRRRTKVTNDPGFNAYLMASAKTPPKLRKK